MRVLFATSRALTRGPVPSLGEEQITCGPGCPTRRLGDYVISLKTACGKYDIGVVASLISGVQKPDVLVVESDPQNQPGNLHVFDCPKVLLVSQTHGTSLGLSSALEYAVAESFDRVVLTENPADSEFFRAAGMEPFWIPALTLPDSDAAIRGARCDSREPRLAAPMTVEATRPWTTQILTGVIHSGLPLEVKVNGFGGLLPWYGQSAMGLVTSDFGQLAESNFEILAAGALLLTERLPDVSGQPKLWREDEVVTYSSADELVEKARYFINHPAEARRIALAGAQWFDRQLNEHRRHELLERVVASRHSAPEFELQPSVLSRVQYRSVSSLAVGFGRLRDEYAQKTKLSVDVHGELPGPLVHGVGGLPRLKLATFSTEAPIGRGEILLTTGTAAFSSIKLPSELRALWCWDSSQTKCSRINQIARSLGYIGSPAQNGWFERPVWTEISEAAKARGALEQGRYEAALELAKSALKQNRRALEGHLVLADLALEAGNDDLFRKAAAECRALAPTDNRIAAIELRALAHAPRYRRFRSLQFARRAFASQDYEVSTEFSALAAGLGDPEALSILVQCNLARGRFTEAVGALCLGAERSLNDPLAWFDAGLAALGSKHYADACAALLHADALLRENDHIQLALGMAAQGLGLQPVASGYFNQVASRGRAGAIVEGLGRGNAVRSVVLSEPEARDLVICNGEVTRLHGTGVLLQRLLGSQTDLITLRSQTLYGGKVELPGVHLVFRGPGLSFSQRNAQLGRLLSPFRIRRILCVPFAREDFENALALSEHTQAPVCTYVMDDQVAYGNVPAELAVRLFTRSKLRLVISPEMRDAYAQRFNLEFTIMPPLVSSTAMRVENRWKPSSNKQAVLVGNIWSETQFERLRHLIKASGAKLDWYGNPNVRWLTGRHAELERDGIFCRGFVPEAELAARVAEYAFVIVPSGVLDGSEKDEWLTRLSLPSRMVFVLSQTFTPMLVLGHPDTCAARFVARFGIGRCASYDTAATNRSVQQMLCRETQARYVENGRAVANAFYLERGGEWIWRSLADARAQPAPFSGIFDRMGALSVNGTDSDGGRVAMKAAEVTGALSAHGRSWCV